MLRIGDFSQLAQVSIRTLRLYDELGLLKPAQVDRFTDYRYYSMEQLPRLNRILALKDLGFSLDQIARLLNERLSADQLQGMLLMKQSEMEREVQDAQTRLARVEARLRQIRQEGQLPKYEVVLKKVEAQVIAAGRRVVPSVEAMAQYRCALYDEVYGWLTQHEIAPLTPELAIYHNPEYTDTDIDMEAAVTVKGTTPHRLGPIAVRELPAVATMASVIHTGPFPEVCDAIIALYRWIGSNQCAADGPYRELHLFGRENDCQDFNAVVLEVQIPVCPLDSLAT